MPRAAATQGKLAFCRCALEGHEAFILSTWHPGTTYHPQEVHPGMTPLRGRRRSKDSRYQLWSKAVLEYDPRDVQTVLI
jgi:hypothetical protein